MATEYTTTNRSTAIWWWIAGLVALALIIWAIAAHSSNNTIGIPNTGADASSTDMNSSYLNANASTSPYNVDPNIKG